MKYRVLFLIKLSYYLESKKITLNPELYSVFISFISESSFSDEMIQIIQGMMVYEDDYLTFKYNSFSNAYNFIKNKLCDKEIDYVNVKKEFYKLFTKEQLDNMDELVWSFYNYYSLYLNEISEGQEKLPYDYRNSTKIYVLS